MNQGMNNTRVYLERQMYSLRTFGMSVKGLDNLSGQLTLLCFLAGGGAAFLSYWFRSDNYYIVLYGTTGTVSYTHLDVYKRQAVGGGLLLLSRITNEAVGKGDGWFFLVSGIYLGAVKNLVLLAGGLGVCFLLSVVLMFKGILQGTDRGRLRIPLLPFLIPAGIGVMFI